MGDRVAISIIGVLSFAIVFVVGALLLAHQPGRAWSAEVAALPAVMKAWRSPRLSRSSASASKRVICSAGPSSASWPA